MERFSLFQIQETQSNIEGRGVQESLAGVVTGVAFAPGRWEMRQLSLVFCTIVFSFFFAVFQPYAFAGQETIIGTLTRTFRVVTDSGESYYITTKGRGNELAHHHGKRVRVNGEVENTLGEKSITVTEFYLIDDERQKPLTLNPQTGKGK